MGIPGRSTLYQGSLSLLLLMLSFRLRPKLLATYRASLMKLTTRFYSPCRGSITSSRSRTSAYQKQTNWMTLASLRRSLKSERLWTMHPPKVRWRRSRMTFPVRATLSTRYPPSVDNSTGKIQATLKKIEHAVHLGSWDEAHREAVRLKYLRGIAVAAQSWPDAPPGDH
jgi:hypothetical protein